MTLRQTEMSHSRASGFDLLPAKEALQILASGQIDAAQAVQSAVPQIALAAELAATRLRRGGRLIYAAAGSSGLMALADALELPGTYGIGRGQIRVLLAGGMPALLEMTGGAEDDAEAGRQAVAELEPTQDDCLIALTASGSTPFPVAALETARSAGAGTIGIANNPETPILTGAAVAIYLPTPAEVIAGSTRMGAGTAQKIALNMLSTMMAVHLGHVHDGYMVNVIADNMKLRDRAQNIVASVAGVDEQLARQALEQTGGAIKPAILLAAGAESAAAADRLLIAHEGHLRPALEQLCA